MLDLHILQHKKKSKMYIVKII